jgi:hypothetical protein
MRGDDSMWCGACQADQHYDIDLFDPEWDFWAATHEPIEAVRARIGLTA